jgi:hypothetical protein
MVLRTKQKFRWKKGQPGLFYGCSTFPRCKSAHGAHPDGSPLGCSGDQPTKNARRRAHEAFDALRVARGWTGKRHTHGAYVWLGRKFVFTEERIKDYCHIGRYAGTGNLV